ncbi:zinc finger CCHC domain-containing protein 9 [Tanacetum coccineum]
MVSKRQILARRKFKQENPDLFPKPEPTPPKDPNKKKKKKKSEFKRKKNDPKKPSTKKHPLRIPGMKPGDSCFICKADNHIAKNCPEKAQWEKHKGIMLLICLLCRQRGHSLKNCPDKKEDNIDKKLCYNCGGFGHSLVMCPQPLEDATGIENIARGQVTKFSSGDDLEDDFTMIDDGKEKKTSEPNADAASNAAAAKSKKKQGTKVVNFMGLYRPTMDSSTSSHANQPYSPLNRVSLDMDFEQLMYSQEFYPVEEMSPVKAKKHSKRA